MSNKITLEPGTYVLSQNVTNPGADRRMTRHWLSRPVFEAGSRFLATSEKADSASELMGRDVHHTRLQVINGNSYFYDHDERYAAVAPFLTRVPDDIDTMWTRLGLDSMDLQGFLKFLVTSGEISMERMEQLWTTEYPKSYENEE